MADRPLVEIQDLRVAFGKRGNRTEVVKGVSFTIERGQTVALVGESGSGKTVTSLALLGLVGGARRTKEISGTAFFSLSDGQIKDLIQVSARAMRKIRGDEIAMIFQEPMTSLNPVLRIGEQIAEVLVEHHGDSNADAWKKAEVLLAHVGIPDASRRLRSYPHQLSGGMRQRVMTAMALSCRPSLLIADEPTTALDVTIQAQILDLIADLKAEYGSSVLFITHDLAVVRQIADRVVVMYAGHIVEEGPTTELISDPKHPYTQGLIACVPRVETDFEHRKALRPIPGSVPDPAHSPSGCPFHPRCRHKVEGRCDTDLPVLEEAGGGRRVRCIRWGEIAQDAA